MKIALLNENISMKCCHYEYVLYRNSEKIIAVLIRAAFPKKYSIFNEIISIGLYT